LDALQLWTGQKIMGHQGTGSHDIAEDSAAREPGVASVTRPASAIAVSRAPPRYAARSARPGSTTSAGTVVRSQAGLAGRMARLAGLDPGRVRPWLFARAVQESAGAPILHQVARQLAPA
jgi:hypothetical protein